MSDLEIGATYAVIVGGALVNVTIAGSPQEGGWDGKVDMTGRKVHITCASVNRRVRGRVRSAAENALKEKSGV